MSKTKIEYHYDDWVEVISELLDVQNYKIRYVHEADNLGLCDHENKLITLILEPDSPLGLLYNIAHEFMHAHQYKYDKHNMDEFDRQDYVLIQMLGKVIPGKAWRYSKFPIEIEANGFALMICDIEIELLYELVICPKKYYDTYKSRRKRQQTVAVHDTCKEELNELYANENAKCEEYKALYAERILKLVKESLQKPSDKRDYKVVTEYPEDV
jgi:hypothetical protein